MNSSPKKKRKFDDSRANDVPDCAHHMSNDSGGFFSSWFGYYFAGRGGADASSATSRDEGNKSQLDRMEQMISRMEKKLEAVSSVENRCQELQGKCEELDARCEELEAKCSSLENKLEVTSQSVKDHVDRSMKLHEYNEMLARNENWKYSADTSAVSWGYGNALAAELRETVKTMKDMTIKMRRGQFPDHQVITHKGVVVDVEGISLDPVAVDFWTEDLLPHWKELTAALKQFTPAIRLLPEEHETYFRLGEVWLNQDVIMLLKDALIGKPFKDMVFDQVEVDAGDDEFDGMSVDDILEIVESNKYLRRLAINQSRILAGHIERLCSIVHNYPLVELDLWSSCNAPGVGNAMLTSLLSNGELKLEKLYISACGINSDVSMLIANFIATNQRLKELHLEDNHLDDDDAALIANALRSNTTLRRLHLDDNDDITDFGLKILRLALYNENSLNAVAVSNHSCCLPTMSGFDRTLNSSEAIEQNRARKIYALLSSRHVTGNMSNVQHFGDIDVKILPNILGAVQRYSNLADEEDAVGSLSIIYEVIRNWEQIFSL